MAGKLEVGVGGNVHVVDLIDWSVSESASSIRAGASTPAVPNLSFSVERNLYDNYTEWMVGEQAQLRYSYHDNGADLITPGVADFNDAGPIVNVDDINPVGAIASGGAGTRFARLSQVVSAPAYRNVTLSTLFTNYFALAGGPSLTFSLASNPVVSVEGWRDNVWSKVNDLCVAYRLQIVPDASFISAVVRDISFTPSATFRFEPLSPPREEASFLGSSAAVEIGYRNTESGTAITFFDALQYDNRVISVAVGERRADKFDIDVWPIGNSTPITFLTATDNVNIGNNEYRVLSSDNQTVTAAEWSAANGQVSVRYVGEVERGSFSPILDSGTRGFYLQLQGPDEEIPGKPGPYSFATWDGVERFGAMRINAEGVKVTPEVVSIGTGRSVVDAQNVVKKISPDNVFLFTKDMAMNVASWTVDDAGGPSTKLSAVFGIDVCEGFAVTCGTIFEYMDQYWRIDQCAISNASFSVVASRATTAGHVDAAWAGQTAGAYATVWSGRTAKDSVVRPLWGSP